MFLNLPSLPFLKVNVQNLRGWAPDEFYNIMAHVEAFESSATKDFDGFVQDLNLNFNFDLFDHFSLLQALDESLKSDSISYSHVTTILQNLLIPSRLYADISR